MTWYKKLSDEFFSTHVRSTKLGKEEAQKAFDNTLRSISPTMLFTTVQNMLAEVPVDTIVWRLVDKEYTSAAMISHLEDQTPEGSRFVYDLLRVSSDLIRQAAQRKVD